MSEEIWDLTEARQRMYMQELERCKNEDCDFYLEHNNVNEFYDYITNLQEKNERLNNIINEFENYLNIYLGIFDKDDSKREKACFCAEIIYKLQELKGSDKSEK